MLLPQRELTRMWPAVELPIPSLSSLGQPKVAPRWLWVRSMSLLSTLREHLLWVKLRSSNDPAMHQPLLELTNNKKGANWPPLLFALPLAQQKFNKLGVALNRMYIQLTIDQHRSSVISYTRRLLVSDHVECNDHVVICTHLLQPG